MVINLKKNGQFFPVTYTVENGGLVSLDILPTAQYIRVVKTGVADAGKDMGFEAYKGDFANPFVYVGGAAGAVTLAKKALGAISFSTEVVKLAAGKVTKTSGLEIDFAGFSMPQVGDAIMLSPTKRVEGDDYLTDRSLFVISVSGTKAKCMLEVPSGLAIDSSAPIFAKVSSLHGKQAQLKYGIDVTSVTRSGSTVTLKGSHSKLIGMTNAMGGLKIDEDSPLLVAMKKKSGQMKQFTIISMNEGIIKVEDPESLINAKAIGAGIIGTAFVVPVGGYTLISSITCEATGASKNVTIDLTKLTGAVAGDTFIVEAQYGGAA